MNLNSTAIDSILAALADPTRRHVIDLLRERPRRAGELAAALQMSGPAMSRHLRVLRTNKLVEETHPENDARQRIYQLRPERFSDLQNWLESLQSPTIGTRLWRGEV